MPRKISTVLFPTHTCCAAPFLQRSGARAAVTPATAATVGGRNSEGWIREVAGKVKVEVKVEAAATTTVLAAATEGNDESSSARGAARW